MGNVFVTSDLHFGHDREFVYEVRGYKSIEEHDEAIVSNWNSVVSQEDDVYLLGDIMLCDAKKGAELVKRLHGKIHLIRGNHDTDDKLKLYAILPNIVEIADAKYYRLEGGPTFYMSHYPTLVAHEKLKRFKNAIINLYGHTHQKDNFFMLEGEKHPYMYHVGVDSHDYYPVLLADIIEEVRMAKEGYDGNHQEGRDPFEVWRRTAEELQGKHVKVYESHGHFNLKAFDGVREELMELMHTAGIEKCIIPAIEYDTIWQIKDIFDKPEYDWVKYAFGSHPKYIWKEQWGDNRWRAFKNMLKDPKCIAVGETGLDYSYSSINEEHRSMQMEMFVQFIRIANEMQLPVILHIRPVDPNRQDAYEKQIMSGTTGNAVYCPDAQTDALQIIKDNPIENGAVLHCFYGGVEDMQAYLGAGVTHFGIGGRICQDGYPQLREAIKVMPEQCIILETDSPFIKIDNDSLPNTSLSLLDIAAKIAELRGVTIEHIFGISYENTRRLFSKNND